MFPVNQPSFHTSYYQFVTSTCNIANFHYKTWRTIVNIRFCSVNQIELYNLEPTHRSTNIKLNKQLPFRVVDYHIVRSPLPGPHINHRFNIRLSFTCPGTKNCYRTAFYPYFYAITAYVQRTFLPPALRRYRPTVETHGRIIFRIIADTVSPSTRCR